MNREQELRRRGVRYGTVKSDVDPHRRQIGDRLRELRLKAGLTAREVAERMRAADPDRFGKWSPSMVSNIQTGRHRTLRVDELLPLARIFGVSVDEFLTGEPAVEQEWAQMIGHEYGHLPPAQLVQMLRFYITGLAAAAPAQLEDVHEDLLEAADLLSAAATYVEENSTSRLRSVPGAAFVTPPARDDPPW